MVSYPDPSGGSMEVANQAQAIAQGWTPSMGTFGTASDPNAGGGSSGSSGDGSSSDQQATSDVLAGAAASAGTSIADLAEKKREFDATLQQQINMWQQQGLPQLQIQQQAQALAQQEYQSQTQLAQQNLQLAQKTQADSSALAQQTQGQTNANNVAALTGTYSAPGSGDVTAAAAKWQAAQTAAGNSVHTEDFANQPASVQAQYGATAAGPGIQTLASQQQGFNQNLQSSQNALAYLNSAAALGGPADYFQQSNFLRGAASGVGQTPAFLSSLQNNTGLAAFNAPSGAAPTVQSMGTLANGLSTGSQTGAAAPGAQNAALSSINAIGAAGAQALSPQALESLNPDETNLLQSGLKASGYSMPSFLQAYQQSRIGQGAAQAA